MTRPRGSLAARVAVGTAASAGLVAIVAAAASLAVAARLVRDGEDARLRAAAAAFAAELPPGPGGPSLASAIEQEEAELAPASIRIAVRDATSFHGGDAHLPSPPPGTCASHEAGETSVRACAIEAGAFRIVTASTQARGGWLALVAACASAALVAAVTAAALGRRTAQWALSPLTRLRRSLDGIDAAEPRGVKLEGGDGVREVAALRDSTQALLRRLADALDSARGFSADAAHELRTPLTVIRGELDLLAEEPLDPATARAVERVRARARALVVLTERLLVLASAPERLDVAREAVSLEEIVGGIVENLDAEGRARVQARLDSVGMVRGDEALLTALVENAVDNALKFSSAAPVSVLLRDDGERVTLEVVDAGRGLAEGDREHAFEPFFRAAGARAAGTSGHGIGLALVSRIVAAHRGTVALLEREDGLTGVRLRVELPAWRPQASA